MKSRRSALSPKQLMLLITLFLSIVGGIWQLTLMLPRRLKRRPAAPAPVKRMDNASLECQAAGSDRHSADDRELLRGEWEPALLTALRAVAPLVEEPS